MKPLLLLTLLVSCSQEPNTSSLLEEFPAWKGERPYQVYQHWTKDGKSYSVTTINFGDTTYLYRDYAGHSFKETYYLDELTEVVEYR